MIKSNELRLGNLLWNPVQEIHVKVDVMLLHEIDLSEKAKIDYGWEPIPLTADRLYKIGFYWNNGRNHWERFMFDNIFEVIKFLPQHGSFAYILGKDRYKLINYVHELQNLHFDLNGEELSMQK